MTDEQLEQLKLVLAHSNWFDALIARLEAAEAVVRIAAQVATGAEDNIRAARQLDALDAALAAWRKVAGKEGT